MAVLRKFVFLGLGIFFLWLTLSIPSIPELFTIDISNLTKDDRVLLQYASLVFYCGCMLATALEGEIFDG